MALRQALALLVVTTALAGCISDSPDTNDDDTLMDPEGGRWSRVAEGTYSVFPGDYRFDHELGGSVTLVNGSFDVQPVVSEVLSSDLDGADIDFSYWLPDTDKPVPVIIQASPYFASTDAPSGSQQFGQWMADVFVPHGYAYVQLAIRSTAASGGCDDFRGPNMVADMDQAIDWLADQDWSTGKVALMGKSYPGSTPWYAAGADNEAIKTIVPVSGSTNAWEVYNRNGTPETRSAIIIPNYGVSAATNDDRSNEHKVENFACTEVWEGWLYGPSMGVTGERLPPEWWEERNAKPKVLENYEGSVLLVHGFEDWNVDPAVALPFADELNRTGVPVKQLLGQWAHDYPDKGQPETMRWDWAQILLNWFDRYLKDVNVDVGPPVQVQSNDGRWRDELHWPPHDTDWNHLHLDNNGLAEEPGDAGQATVLYGDESPLAVQEGDVGQSFYFRHGPVEQDLLVSGLPKVHVTATPTGPSGYLGATLYSESPDGEMTRIGWTGMNLRFHEGTETPSDLVPGEKVLAKMEIQPMDALVPEGHTLVLRIGSQTASDRIAPPHPAPVILHWGGDDTSVLKIPLLERGEEAFFEPPMP